MKPKASKAPKAKKRKCKGCGKVLPADTRADRATCSNKCRQKAYRQGPPISAEDWAAIRKVNAMDWLPPELRRPPLTPEEIRAHVAATAVRTGDPRNGRG